MEIRKERQVVKINNQDLDLEVLILDQFDQGQTLSTAFEDIEHDKKKGFRTLKFDKKNFFTTYVKTNGILTSNGEKELIEVGLALVTPDVKKAFGVEKKPTE